ncbi:MAG: fructosamine kinase family protein [Alphaproteobacteria bacterium]|nr:fructosamine kinase family protein [Alphaproteobacteria bacterium]
MQVVSNPLSAKITELVEKSTRRLVVSAVTLAGGAFDTKHVILSDGSQVVVKLPKQNGQNLAIEGKSVDYLSAHTSLPQPKVFYIGDDAFIHEFILADGVLTFSSEPQAAQMLAELHKNTSSDFGFDFDTVYQGNIQPNKKSKKWVPFFTENRLLFVAKQAMNAGYLPVEVGKKIEQLAGKLSKYIDEPAKPCLIHGDINSSTILCYKGAVKSFVDPAVCFADNEYEFIHTGKQSSFSKKFFNIYNDHMPLRVGFFEVRLPIYNLYPLLCDIRAGKTQEMDIVLQTLNRFL